jgi:predicted metalloprotease
MLWKNRRQSVNVEDRRGMSAGGGIALGGGGLLVVIALALLFGQDPAQVLEQLGGGGQLPSAGSTQQAPLDPHEEELKQFVSVVLADTEEVWSAQFASLGLQYEMPTLVFFSGSVDSACGQASSAVGPFYCPGDHNLYLDLSFLDDLSSRFGAGGDFPAAYVIAHEVGHHVQNLLGTMEKVDAMRAQGGSSGAEGASVRLELQADFYAGVWAHHAQARLGVLEPGDIEEALNAASAIGDDRLQQQSQGYVVPDSFTHGSSAQRMRWFKLGYETGDMSKGDTFSAREL